MRILLCLLFSLTYFLQNLALNIYKHFKYGAKKNTIRNILLAPPAFSKTNEIVDVQGHKRGFRFLVEIPLSDVLESNRDRAAVTTCVALNDF